ncbi:MAG: M28 family peptidase [Phycisphaerae bacterium]
MPQFHRRICTLGAGLLLFTLLPASAADKHDRAAFSAAEFEQHVGFLAADELRGRGIGSPQIDQAADYIAHRFEELGVEPGGENHTFFQPFTVSVSNRIADGTRLAWRGLDAAQRERLTVGADFVPLPFSRRSAFDGELVFVGYGIDEATEHSYNDYEGLDVRNKVLLMFRYEPGWWADHPVDEQEPQPAAPRHTRHSYFTTKAEHAVKRGARAILLVDPVPTGKPAADTLYDFTTGRAPTMELPMIHLTRAAANAMLRSAELPSIERLQAKIEQHHRPCSVMLHGVRANGFVAVARNQTPVKNVVGVIRGHGPHADEYVVVGAHYDHLGYTRNFRKPDDPNSYIHNGADDNASGTSGLMLVAEAARRADAAGRSILLIAFSAEESGLLGSKHWVDHPTVPLDHVAAMLNMDMIGRLKDDVLQVGGMGTGAGFDKLIDRLAKPAGFTIHNGGGGRGPSDHASFYGKKIPVLFFFTGMHKQYHQPEDDVALINAEGGARVAHLAFDCLMEIANADDRPGFKTDVTRFNPEMQSDGAAPSAPGRSSADRSRPGQAAAVHSGDSPAAEGETPAMPRVRMGIAPGNYGEAEGRGLPIEYVIADGPAAKAGIKDGDRILKINDKPIGDVYSFMSALSAFKPGDVATVVVLRGERELTFKVTLEAGGRRNTQE